MSNSGTKPIADGLLDRALALLEDVPCKSDPTFWRDYLQYSGTHMILTNEGWEPGEAKASYEEMANEEGLPISDFILDEVNVPNIAAALSAAEERERVLREALEKVRHTHCYHLLSEGQWIDIRCDECKTIDAALATPAPEQPSAEKAGEQ